MTDLDEKITNLGRGFCWMRPVDYADSRNLNMYVEVGDRGSVLMLHGYPLLHYDGDTVWADLGQWTGALQKWQPWVTSSGRRRRRGLKREEEIIARKKNTVHAVMKRCLPMHWTPNLPAYDLCFKASDRQAPLPMPTGIFLSSRSIPMAGLLVAVELPQDFDLGAYHACCPRPKDRRYSRVRTAKGDQHSGSLNWRTIRREFLVRKDVPPCPWPLPLHRNRTSPEEAK